VVEHIADVNYYVDRSGAVLGSMNRYYSYALGGYKTQAILAGKRGDVAGEARWNELARYIERQRSAIHGQILDISDLKQDIRKKKPKKSDVAKQLSELSENQFNTMSRMKEAVIEKFPGKEKWVSTIDWHKERVHFVHDRSNILIELEKPLEFTVILTTKSKLEYHEYTVKARDLQELRDNEIAAGQSIRRRFGYTPVHDPVKAKEFKDKGRAIEEKRNKRGEKFWLLERWNERTWSEVQKTIKPSYKSSADKKAREDFEKLHSKYRRKR
jgi:hypothetical protein